MNRSLVPAGLAPPAANYAHATLSEGPQQLLHTSGVVPVALDGSTPDDVGEQARLVWSNIGLILAEAQMSMTDIVSVVTYVVVGEDLGPVMKERDHALDGHLAASTLVTVPALAQPAWRVEIAVVAAS